MAVRGRELSKLASELGMAYREVEDFGLTTQLKDFQLFRRGRSRKITHEMYRQENMLQMQVRIFDYKFVTGGGNSRRVWRQTVFFMDSRQLGLPQFLMKPENFFYKIGQFLGMKDIDFEAFPKFSKQYWLSGEDEEMIRRALSDKLLHLFSVEKNWTLEGLNYYLIFYRSNHLLPARQIRQFYHKGLEIAHLLAESNPFRPIEK